jgi:hypothetical protein
VVVAIPYSPVTPVTTDWVISLMNLQMPPGTRVQFQRGVPIDVSRNTLVRSAQENKAAYIFFLDADVLAPSDIVPRLMSWKVPIVSGVYWSKKGYPAVWDQHPSGRGFTPVKQLPTKGLVEVAGISMGASLVDMRVFSCIPDPWFEWGLRDPRREGEGLGHSEDLSFFEKASKYGFKLYVDPEMRCLHESVVPVNVEGEMRFTESQREKKA